MSHTKDLVVDRDPHFRVDPNTRKIEYLSSDSLVLIQGDHNSERITFAVPRYVEGHDMSECNTIQVHYINMSSANKAAKSSGVYEVSDVSIDPNDEYTVLFTWLLSQGTTLHVGSLNFVLRFACIEGSTVLYSWNTTVYSQVNVFDTIDNINNMPTVYTDILENWYAELMSAGELGVNVVNQTKDAALAEMEASKDKSLEEIAKAEQEAIDHIESVEVIREVEQEVLDNIETAKNDSITELNEVKEDVVSQANSAAAIVNEATEDLNTAKESAVTAVTEQETSSKEALDTYGNSILNDLQNASVKSALYLKERKLFDDGSDSCDLNTIFDEGVYVTGDADGMVMKHVTGSPIYDEDNYVVVAFRLYVSSSDWDHIGEFYRTTQTFETIEQYPRIFRRTSADGVWGDWIEYISSANIASQRVAEAAKADTAGTADTASNADEATIASGLKGTRFVVNIGDIASIVAASRINSCSIIWNKSNGQMDFIGIMSDGNVFETSTVHTITDFNMNSPIKIKIGYAGGSSGGTLKARLATMFGAISRDLQPITYDEGENISIDAGKTVTYSFYPLIHNDGGIMITGWREAD